MPIAGLESEAADPYAAIVWDERFCVPFSPISVFVCGRQIGIADGDDQEKVFEFKGHSMDEWIVNAHSSHNGGMLYREIHIQNVPLDLTSAYDWKKEEP